VIGVVALGVAAMIGASPAVAADDSRLTVVVVNGNEATSIVAGVPEVGDIPAIRRYGSSGRFAADRRIIAAAARAELASIIETRCPLGPSQCRSENLAIVVDIDDTLLNWYPKFARHDFRLKPSIRQAAVRACSTPVISSVRELVRDAQAAGIGVLIVTGRREPARADTEGCLKRRGVDGFDALVLRTEAQDRLPAVEYKKQAYRALLSQGWLPVLSIGDQVGDLVGETDTARFLLPNPMYVSK
jgi:hypothetical protein